MSSFKRGLRLGKGSGSNAWATPDGEIIKSGRKEHGKVVGFNAEKFNLDPDQIQQDQPDDIELVERAVEEGAIRIVSLNGGFGLMVNKQQVTDKAFQASQKFIKKKSNNIESVTIDYVKGGEGRSRVTGVETVDPRAYINASSVNDIDDFQPSTVQQFHQENGIKRSKHGWWILKNGEIKRVGKEGHGEYVKNNQDQFIMGGSENLRESAVMGGAIKISLQPNLSNTDLSIGVSKKTTKEAFRSLKKLVRDQASQNILIGNFSGSLRIPVDNFLKINNVNALINRIKNQSSTLRHHQGSKNIYKQYLNKKVSFEVLVNSMGVTLYEKINTEEIKNEFVDLFENSSLIPPKM